MERTTSCSSGQIRETDDPKDYSEPLAKLADQPLILGSKSVAACSAELTEIVLSAGPAQRPAVRGRPDKSIRLLDLSVAGLILLLVLPLMLACALAIMLSSRGPVIYRQARIGLGGREFTCFKFRTMTPTAATLIDDLLIDGSPYRDEWAALYKLRADPRVTYFGRFMRRYSLDELPQLFNVFNGDMSLVGPRPIVADEIGRYGDRFADYCSVKPGITGLWQVSGRHALSYEDRVRLDAQYARNKSTRLDLLILWRTFPVVLFGQNE